MQRPSLFVNPLLVWATKATLEANHWIMIHFLEKYVETKHRLIPVRRAFKQIKKVGEGGYGEVFWAQSFRTKNFMALKRVCNTKTVYGVGVHFNSQYGVFSSSL